MISASTPIITEHVDKKKPKCLFFKPVAQRTKDASSPSAGTPAASQCLWKTGAPSPLGLCGCLWHRGGRKKGEGCVLICVSTLSTRWQYLPHDSLVTSVLFKQAPSADSDPSLSFSHKLMWNDGTGETSHEPRLLMDHVMSVTIRAYKHSRPAFLPCPPPQWGKLAKRVRVMSSVKTPVDVKRWWGWCELVECVTYPWPWQPSLLETSLCSSPSRRSLSSSVKESGSSTFCEGRGGGTERGKGGESENELFENKPSSFTSLDAKGELCCLIALRLFNLLLSIYGHCHSEVKLLAPLLYISLLHLDSGQGKRFEVSHHLHYTVTPKKQVMKGHDSGDATGLYSIKCHLRRALIHLNCRLIHHLDVWSTGAYTWELFRNH